MKKYIRYPIEIELALKDKSQKEFNFGTYSYDLESIRKVRAQWKANQQPVIIVGVVKKILTAASAVRVWNLIGQKGKSFPGESKVKQLLGTMPRQSLNSLYRKVTA